MAEVDVTERIRTYLDHIQDAAYVRSIFEGAGVATVVSMLAEMIRGGDREAVGDALLFVRDAPIFHLAPKDFHDVFSRSDLLAARDYFNRGQAIYTLGKVGPTRNADFLANALPWYAAHDPLNLDGLLFELSWLRHRTHRRDILRTLGTAPLDLTRWATVEILWERKSEYNRSGRFIIRDA